MPWQLQLKFEHKAENRKRKTDVARRKVWVRAGNGYTSRIM